MEPRGTRPTRSGEFVRRRSTKRSRGHSPRATHSPTAVSRTSPEIFGRCRKGPTDYCKEARDSVPHMDSNYTGHEVEALIAAFSPELLAKKSIDQLIAAGGVEHF